MGATAVGPPAIRGYRMLRLLGKGGMGEVWLADDLSLGRRVAIKTITVDQAGASIARGRFLREARVMATVEHPHVVRVYAYGDVAGLAYFVMEFVDGETLAARLRRVARLAPAEALRVTRQVALALGSAWKRGVVHRDVKPSNVLLDADSVVRVADFGLARATSGKGDQTLTRPGAVVGSPHYMSPEQARGCPLDFRSDVYSLGVVLYEMLTGARPFRGESPVEIIAHHLRDPLPPLRGLGLGLTTSLVALVEEMTAKDPEARPASYGALLERVERLAETTASRTSTALLTSTLPSARWRGARRPRTVTALALAAVLGATFWARGRTPEAPPAASVAIAPFYGPDETSAKDGRMLTALVEAELSQRLGRKLRVLGGEDVGPPIRAEGAARALAERLLVDSVLWGQALSLGTGLEAQPFLTTMGSTDALSSIAVDRAHEPGSLERQRLAARALSEALLVRAAREVIAARPEAALLLAERAGEGPEARSLAAEARRRLGSPAP